LANNSASSTAAWMRCSSICSPRHTAPLLWPPYHLTLG